MRRPAELAIVCEKDGPRPSVSAPPATIRCAGFRLDNVAADFDFEALGLLDGLDGEARKERVELIEWLLNQGFSIDRICESAAAPLMLPASRALGDDGHYVSAREVCEATGIELQLLQRLQHAIGLQIDDPDAAVLLRADGEAAARAKFFLDLGFDPDDTVALMRVVIEKLGHVAEIMREAGLKTLLRPGASELELAQASEQLALRSAPMLAPVMEDLIRLELRRSNETDAVTAAERAAGTLPGGRTVTVCFADLAGFTRLGEAIPPEDLERVASRFAEVAHHVARSPVRFVKSIGDAVMLISFDAVPLLHAVLDLIDAAAENDLPRLRIGVASGLAVSRAGDWFGSPVNVASRVTAEARPGTVMVAESTRDAAGSATGFEWSPAGVRRLKGVSDEVKLFRVCRASVQVDS
jgi:adenylate cyclase